MTRSGFGHTLPRLLPCRAPFREDDSLAETTGRDRALGRPLDGGTLLRLGRSDDPEARAELRAHAPEAIAHALLDLAPAQRAAFLELSERVEEIVPLLPEAAFTATVRGAGIEEHGWLVGFATPEQRVAAVDLDCWQGFRLSPSRLLQWIDALIEAGPETLVAAFDELDPEVWALALRAMGRFAIAGMDGDGVDGATDDGLVFYEAHSGEDEERIREILTAARQHAPSHYWRLVQAALSEGDEENEQMAARWQRGRLADLGFPEREHAMRIYAPLAVEDAPATGAQPADGRLPDTLDDAPLERALAGLGPRPALEVAAGIAVLANALAVADRLPLVEPETGARALAKALRGVERGLVALARARGLPPVAVLAGTPARDLFRIGVTLDPSLRPAARVADLDADDGADWNVEIEEID
ncbi:MAG: DUF6178 family protein [Myxococcota bacterium]